MAPSANTRPYEAYRGDAPYVFVSYSHQDEEAVYRELIRLKKFGFKVWYDEGISPGSHWSEELAERITNCKLFLFFVTPRSVASQNCRDEANFVLEAGNPFLAVHLEETELPLGLKLRMGPRQAILKYNFDSAIYERKLQTAIEALSSKQASADSDLLLGFRIGEVDVEPLGGTLTPDNGNPVHLEPKVMDVLILLAGHVNQIVTREQLLQAVWTGQVAADELLTRAVSELRRAFGDDRGDPKYILTVPKRGYRLIGDVVPREVAKPAKTDAINEARSSSTMHKRAYVAVSVAGLIVTFFAIDRFIIYTSESGGSDLSEPSDMASEARPIAPGISIRPLTSMEGFEYEAALSPDGSYVAFTWLDRLIAQRGVIYVQQVNGGTPIRLTDSEESEHFPVWSPDGTRLAFIRDKKSGERDFIVKPLLGGFEHRVATFDGFAIELDWSTDGRYLAFSGLQGEARPYHPYQIYFVALNDGEIRGSTERVEGHSDVRPKFSPDGKSLAHLRFGRPVGGADICLRGLKQSEARCITPEDRGWLIQDFDWTPDSQAIVAITGGLSGLSTLTQISVATGVHRDLPFGDGAMDVSIARNGGRLVFERLFMDHNLWRVAGPGAAENDEPVRLVASTWDELSPNYSPDGTKLAFVSARSGSWEVWVAGSDGSQPRQLTNWGFAAFPSWSPDGQQIAFSTGTFEESGDALAGYDFKMSETFVVDASGGIPRLFSEGRYGASNPSWSRDGRWIYFQTHKEDCGHQLRKRNVDTGEEVQLVRCAWGPLEGPDRRVYFINAEVDGIDSVTLDGEDHRTELEPPSGCDVYSKGWTFWERNLIYIDCEDHMIKALDLDTREIRELGGPYEEHQTSLDLGLTVSPDGRWITYSQLDRSGSDLMLVEPFQ